MKQLARSSHSNEMQLIDIKSRKRAIRALSSLPFNLKFYSDLEKIGLDAEGVLEKPTRYCRDEMKWFNRLNNVEDSFRWLIIVGVLRREVDGQGLTSRIRLTPMGSELILNKRIFSKKITCLSRTKNWFLRNWIFR